MNLLSQTPKIDEVQVDVVQCPRQPGRLTISSHACAQRYCLARKRDLRLPKNEFGVAIISGLKTCRHCPDGRYFWRKSRGVASCGPSDHGNVLARIGPPSEGPPGGKAPCGRSRPVGFMGVRPSHATSNKATRRC